MGTSRVVRPETRKLTISDGDWLIVKKRLNHGERQQAFARGYTITTTGAVPQLLIVDTIQIVAYLVDWSLVGPDDMPMAIRNQPVDVVQSMIDTLDPESVKEIATAVSDHVAQMDAEREAEKNGQGGTSTSATISPLLCDADGPFATSVS